ncbi:unnamed protein product [Spirodela intermedia]|uniref:Uncharacterized protein n=1 Tax=Spirodela intermedia TaxID=51605 RepID=A0A7I8J9A6_SPIIN|nr:unnamed protein product [Spirodela intermedia]CAA6666013.1 unnamed protein product [Spirodela intermedia]
MAKIAIGSSDEPVQPDCIRAAVAELILTFLFVFAGVGAAMAADGGRRRDRRPDSRGRCSRFSGGCDDLGGPSHLWWAPQPAVTLGLLVGGHISIIRSIIYVVAQLLGSSLACLLLKYLTGGLDTPVHTLAAGMDAIQGLIMEIVLTFSLLFTVYGTIVDPKKIVPPGLGPLLVGLVVGANILAGGPFSGASMNPARSFGPALAIWDWTDHWVYWVGPLIGGALAGLVYDNFFIIESTHDPSQRGRKDTEELSLPWGQAYLPISFAKLGCCRGLICHVFPFQQHISTLAVVSMRVTRNIPKP